MKNGFKSGWPLATDKRGLAVSKLTKLSAVVCAFRGQLRLDGNNCSIVLVLFSMRISKNFKTFIQRAQVMRVATIGKNGLPQVVPVCPLFHSNRIYFVTDVGTVKLKNIQRQPKIAVVFDHYEPSWKGLKGIMIQGRPRVIRRGNMFYDLRKRFYRKFPPYKKNSPFDVGESVIVEVTPRKSFSWAE